jgi:hypothetical protein
MHLPQTFSEVKGDIHAHDVLLLDKQSRKSIL